MHIRVTTWNIHKAIGGMDRRYDLDRVIDALAEQEPDIALLQEVADGIASFVLVQPSGDNKVVNFGSRETAGSEPSLDIQ